MKPFVLYIGDRNLSSWSLPAWLSVVVSGAEFEEELIRLDRPDTQARISAVSPSGMVPVLKHGELAVWDSLAICEYMNDLYPDAALWPADAHRRAHARSISAEMHSGFRALCSELPTEIASRKPRPMLSPAAEAELARVIELLSTCRARYHQFGPYLFGPFSIADCMYAPVITRSTTYDLALPDALVAYREMLYARPAMRRWIAAAEHEAREAPGV